jgi:NACHT domain
VRPLVCVKLYLLDPFHSYSWCQFLASLFNTLEPYINKNAAYDSREREDEQASICKEHTREKVLIAITAWAERRNGHPVCWLVGPAGSGKSTIAHTIAKRYDRVENGCNRLAFSFFFSRRNRDRSDATRLFLTLAYRVAITLPSAKQAMEDALAKDPSILDQCLEHQFTKLIVNPVLSITKPISPSIIVIDGLDECGSQAHVKELIRLLIGALPELPFRLLFTSRPEDYINKIFTSPLIAGNVECISLRDFDAIGDVYTYLWDELLEVQRNLGLSPSWLSGVDLWTLVKKSEGIFMYASTLVKFVGDKEGQPRQRLQNALHAHKGLDSLFEQVLNDANKYADFHLVLGAVLFLRRNPHISILPELLQLDSVHDVRLALRGCLSILWVPDSDYDYIRPYHKSLLDFLTDPHRRKDRFFDSVECNRTIVISCIKLITSDSECNAGALKYACGNWIHHMHMVLSCATDVSQIDLEVIDFLTTVLPWFKNWMVGLGSHYQVEWVQKDLHSALILIKVGWALLHVTMSNAVDKGTVDSTCISHARTSTNTQQN